MDKKYAAQEAITHSMMGSLGLKLIEERRVLFALVCLSMTILLSPSEFCAEALHWRLRRLLPDMALICAVRKDSFQSEARFLETMLVQCARRRDVLVYAEATALHLGRTTHLWNVDIKTENGRLVSTVRVTNFIVKDKSESWK